MPEKKKEFAPVPNWLLCRKEVTSTGKLLYGRITQYVGKNGTAWPSIRVLAEELGVVERQIKRVIQELEGKKLIKVTRPKDGVSTSYYSILGHPWMKQHKKNGAVNGKSQGNPSSFK